MTRTVGPARIVLQALGTTALIAVTDPGAAGAAERVLRAELAAIDAACSRFLPGSEISRLHTRSGAGTRVSPLLAEALTVALSAAEQTDGIVDPTVGAAVRALGYDRDFAAVADRPAPLRGPEPAPGWWRVGWDPATGTVVLPRGVLLDLGATAKALCADRIATRTAAAVGTGVLVSLGGDVRVAGPAPDEGWRIAVGDDHERALVDAELVVGVVDGGLATSSTTRRTWRLGRRTVHHIVDPRTGDIPASPWRTVSVAAATCVEANTASTAAVVLGDTAPAWLAGRGLPARLVAVDGAVTTTAGWPDPERSDG